MQEEKDIKIIYTITDEAPYLATYSLLPIFQRFAKPYGIQIERSDISVAGRIIANFSEFLKPEQRIPDNLAILGELCKTPDGNIIKLPNISASIPQLKEAIAELQSQGYNIPNYNPNPKTEEEKAIKDKFSKVLGSAVNPVLREGNSDRRCAEPVKKNCQSIKKRTPALQQWAEGNRSSVKSMTQGDFFSSEQSHIFQKSGSVTITLHQEDGQQQVLKKSLKLEDNEIIDAATLNAQELCAYFEKEFTNAKQQNLMISLHLKATMMKVSDPIIFGHCVKTYFKDVFAKYKDVFAALDVNVNNGLGDVYEKIKGHALQQEIEAALQETYNNRPGLAMVDSSKGITNLHVPSDVIIDASMPNVVRDGGRMWNKNDQLEEVTCLIPDRSYSGIYQEIIADCQKNGQFDHTTMGHTANVGLMAKKAEEYGSHDKTFEIPANGKVIVTNDADGSVIFTHNVQQNDIYRMCQTKNAPIRDWVKLAVNRAKATGDKTIFWLQPSRPHDANLIQLAKKYLQEDHNNGAGLDIEFQTPEEAIKICCVRARQGLNNISVTGNVLRDYLTDLFPIIELGTSAKMLSIVPLLAGGVLLETGAGGSAPLHIKQVIKENHLRWDSLGEYLATAIGFQELGQRANNEKATRLGNTLMDAIGIWLNSEKTPGRKVGQIDNRGSNFYLALYWAQAMAKIDNETFGKLAQQLTENEQKIAQELIDCQGKPSDLGGYYHADFTKTDAVMRPSQTLNAITDNY